MSSKEEVYAEKITKLLRKAESTTPEEAELLYEKAQELMTKYSIDEAMLAAARGDKTDDVLGKEEFVTVGIYRYPLSQLAYYVLLNNGIKALKLSGANWRQVDGRVFKETEVLVGVGYKSDLDRSRILITSLQLQAMRAENEWWKESKDLYSKKEAHYARRQFLFSFAEGANTKLREGTVKGKAAAQAEHGSGMELVLRDKSLVVADEFKKHFPDTRKSSSRKKGGDAYARENGRAAGLKSDVGQPGISGRRKALNR